jgi:hypothetical protein
MEMTKIKFALVAAVASLWLGPLSAAEFDGSRNLICASMETVGCVAGEDCLKGSAETINIPKFFRIDFGKKTIYGKRPDGEDVNTKIVGKLDGKAEMILQGVQNQLGWSLVIAGKTGNMALTASGDGVAFAVFGACTPLP